MGRKRYRALRDIYRLVRSIRPRYYVGPLSVNGRQRMLEVIPELVSVLAFQFPDGQIPARRPHGKPLGLAYLR